MERNALRANLVRQADEWRWSSFYRWLHGSAEEKRLLSAWPVRRKTNWLQHVTAPQTEGESAAVRRIVERSMPSVSFIGSRVGTRANAYCRFSMRQLQRTSLAIDPGDPNRVSSNADRNHTNS